MLTLQSNHTSILRNPPPVQSIVCNANDYTITNQAEISKRLNHLFNRNTLLSIKIPGKFATSTLLTTINRIEEGYLFLEGFQNQRFNKDLLMQSTLAVTADFDGIAVNFILSQLDGHDIDASFNFKAPFPQSIEWVQRRNARRVKVPINIPVKIQFKNQSEYYNVADISVAGLSYIDPAEDPYFATIGELHSDCTIILPDNSAHLACFEIINNITIPYRHSRQLHRVGCEIKRPSYRLDTALQRLINQIDFYYQ